ncbi:hypothetical protein [uncultured Caulobacter sp.]|uniref:hypothetical protein n=1 Tax=uncultured Caulobacter sp. TaxID=158749 RepID=UPI0026215BBD|nr:hypothetical protein [uncultured Caulobacter sp.]
MDDQEPLSSIPERTLLDTCVLNRLYDEGGYIFDDEEPCDNNPNSLADLEALRAIFLVNERAHFQFLISPLSIAEIANIQDFRARGGLLSWVLDVLDRWLIMLDETGDRISAGGSVRTRFKLTIELQKLETALLEIPDFARDPFDRLLLIQYKMGDCDAFLTSDLNTIWKHRERLRDLGINVIRPAEFWQTLKPWAALWL